MRAFSVVLVFALVNLYNVAAFGAERECAAPCIPLPKTCCVTMEMQKVTKSCWEIEHREVCIPAIRFPWSKCCEPRCGRVRTVHVLKKKEWECQQPKYVWKPVPCTPCDSCAAAGVKVGRQEAAYERF